jgi:hypothetical protein
MGIQKDELQEIIDLFSEGGVSSPRVVEAILILAKRQQAMEATLGIKAGSAEYRSWPAAPSRP